MFHRVKSEIQDSDQEDRQKADLPYAEEESRGAYKAPLKESAPTEEREQERERSSYAAKGKYRPERQDERPSLPQKEDTREEKETVSRAQETPAPVYQRQTFQPSAPRPSSSYAAPYSPPHGASEIPSLPGAERTLTIGRGINMSGEIEACDHLLVEGTVEAALKGSKILDIAESGTFYGTVEIEEATIAGRFEGDITVNGRLTIKASGAITGSIAYRELEVEAGAMLDGRMTPLREPVDPKRVDQYRAGSEASAMAKAKDILSKKDNREPANTESRLFSKARA